MAGPWTNKRPTETEFVGILDEHKKWLFSRGKEGRRAVLRGARLTKAPLAKIDLRVADLTGIFLTKANLTGAHLTKVFLKGAELTGTTLTEADLRGADLKDAVLRASVLRASRMEEVDCRKADFTGADITGADLTGADLKGADLTGADLTIAMLKNADLRGANLAETDLRGADLSGADLRGARLEGADLALTQRRETRVSGPEVLEGTKGLEDVIGFVYGEKEVSPEPVPDREQIPRRLADTEMGGVTIRFPENYGPAELVQVLVYLTMMNQGLRMVLTTPFQDLNGLLSNFSRPEVFNRLQDEHSLKLVPLHSKIIDAVMEGRRGDQASDLDLSRFSDPEVWKKSFTTESLQKQQEVVRQGLNDLLPVLQSDYVPRETKAKAAKVVDKYLEALEKIADKINRKDERVDAALTAYLYAINKIEKLGRRMGEVRITGQDGEPRPLSGTESGALGDSVLPENKHDPLP